MTAPAGAPICPGCQEGLELVPGVHVPVYACNACGGAWLWSDAAIHVMQGQGDALDAELVSVSVSQHIKSMTSAPSVNAGARFCPACGGAMNPLEIAGIQVEFCPTHGTWFDRDEIEQVAAATKKLREGPGPAAHAATGGGGPSGGEMLELAGDVVVGAAKATASAVGSVLEALISLRHPYGCRCNTCVYNGPSD